MPKIAIVNFGRLNPPTRGHVKLARAMKDTANNIGGNALLFLSKSHDGMSSSEYKTKLEKLQLKNEKKLATWEKNNAKRKKTPLPKPELETDVELNSKNPLSYEDKIKFVEDAVGDIVTVIDDDNINNLFDVFSYVYNMGYTECYVFGGSDRVEGFEGAKNYNGKQSGNSDKFYDFEVLEVISAGERNEASSDPDEQASASLLRQCVKDQDYDKFAQFAGTKTLTEEMWDALLYEMGIES